HAWSACPIASGSTSQRRRSRITGPSGWVWPLDFKTNAIQSGVRKTPIRLESVALKTAPATLPPAVAVIATEDETVEGSAQRKTSPSFNSGDTLVPSVA